MSFLQLIQREIMNMLKLLGLGPSSWFHDDDEQEDFTEEDETMQEEEAEEGRGERGADLPETVSRPSWTLAMNSSSLR